MVQLRTLLLSFVLGVASAVPLSSPQSNESDLHVAKRWYSVPTDEEAQPGDFRAWPPCPNDGLRTITYCFETQQAFTAVNLIFYGALAKWTPAVEGSALRFAPDPACTEVSCLCSTPGVSEVALHIMFGQHGEKISEVTLGYTDPSLPKRKPNMPRHYLLWPHVQHPLDYDLRTLRGGKPMPRAVLTMAHAIGHVIGLQHEHQRPEAAHLLNFDCKALSTYQDMRRRVRDLRTPEPAFTQNMLLRDKLALVCRRRDLAEKYFPQAAKYIPHDVSDTRWRSHELLDYNSIMMYDSFTSRLPGGRYPLVTSGDNGFVYMGGASNPREAGPTGFDVERVAQLYTMGPVQHNDPQTSPEEPHEKRSNDSDAPPRQLPTLRVVVPGGLTTTIGPVPTDFPKSTKDPKAVDIAEKDAADCQGYCFEDEVI